MGKISASNGSDDNYICVRYQEVYYGVSVSFPIPVWKLHSKAVCSLVSKDAILTHYSLTTIENVTLPSDLQIEDNSQTFILTTVSNPESDDHVVSKLSEVLRTLEVKDKELISRDNRLVQQISLHPEQLGHHPKTIPVGEYTISISHTLGRGGWSHVYKGTIQDEEVAVKIANDSTPLSTDFVVLSELRGTGCPLNIPVLHHISPKSAECLITTPVGMPLMQYVDKVGSEGKLTQEQANAVLEGIIAALQWTHKRGWVHLDLRPQNIVVVEADRKDPAFVLVDWSTASRVQDKCSGLRGLRYISAGSILDIGAFGGDWFAQPSMDWESAKYFYIWLVYEPTWITSDLPQMKAQRAEMVGKYADDTIMKKLDDLLTTAKLKEKSPLMDKDEDDDKDEEEDDDD